MTDVTKARYFLKHRSSNLQHLETFALMHATAETNYKEVRQQAKNNNKDIDFEQQELECAIDLAVLNYLRKYARLPDDVAKVLLNSTSDIEKRDLATGWYNA